MSPQDENYRRPDLLTRATTGPAIFFGRLAYPFSYYLSLVKCRLNEERDLSDAHGRDETGKSARRNAGDCGDTGRPSFVRRAGLALPRRRLSGGAIDSRQ